ncbi:MAG: LUD domain-containing protein [Haloquadratum sp.]
MTTDPTESFASALADAGVGCTVTTASGFDETVAEAIERPAVGAPLGLDAVSLAETDVTVPPTPRLLEAAETGVTRAHAGIVEHGSFVIRSDEAGTEPVSLYPRKHVGVLRASDLTGSFASAAPWLDDELRAGPGSAVVATGPSATADMGEIVNGVHGPQDVHAVVLSDR